MTKNISIELVDYYLNGNLNYKVVSEADYCDAFYNETLNKLIGPFDEGSIGTVSYKTTQEDYEKLIKMTTDQVKQSFRLTA